MPRTVGAHKVALAFPEAPAPVRVVGPSRHRKLKVLTLPTMIFHESLMGSAPSAQADWTTRSPVHAVAEVSRLPAHVITNPPMTAVSPAIPGSALWNRRARVLCTTAKLSRRPATSCGARYLPKSNTVCRTSPPNWPPPARSTLKPMDPNADTRDAAAGSDTWTWWVSIPSSKPCRTSIASLSTCSSAIREATRASTTAPTASATSTQGAVIETARRRLWAMRAKDCAMG
mmetsp:Transcript_32435/g.84206  ORF Transcript_32435/g.84206 Transcript_32435/m.84206 type:complete len:230 (-) Transcript_32435:1459-2148(-)